MQQEVVQINSGNAVSVRKSGWKDFLIIWSAVMLIGFPILFWTGTISFGLVSAEGHEEDVTGSAIVGASTGSVSDMAMIEIERVGISAPLIFPKSADYKTLKAALEDGVVHYPASSLPGEDGNVFIFGHSSGRFLERNPSYKALNYLGNVKENDIVVIHWKGAVYRYQVTSARVLKPSDASVYLKTARPMLTISTCWPIGDPKQRMVVEAELIATSNQ